MLNIKRPIGDIEARSIVVFVAGILAYDNIGLGP
jgi:hypothetical protein